jgi:L-threonylcarbamoyladenylate synthase
MIVTADTAVTLLLRGEVVAIPTETVYGLAASIRHGEALKKIFSTKERPFFDPLIVHIAEMQELNELVETVPSSVRLLGEKFWPGPLTMVLKKHKSVSDLITADLAEVGVRMPSHPIALEILRQTGPLAAPSANKFGKTSPTRAEHVEQEFLGRVAVVDGGACEIGIESTVLKLEENASEVHVFILRPGGVSQKDLQTVLSTLGKKLFFHKATSAAAPGQLENHYQPATPLVLADAGIHLNSDIHQLISQHLGAGLARPDETWSFGNEGPAIVARRLYAEMRRQSEKNNTQNSKSYIFLELPWDFANEEWDAPRDRLNKASSLSLKILHGQVSALVKNK